jgi:DNA-binding MarR family transcriptional regulator
MSFYDSVPFSPESSIGYLSRRFYQAQVAALEPIFAAEGISMTHWSALVFIYVRGTTTGIEVARDLAYDKGAVTRLLDTLEAKGLLTRTRNTDDRRCVDVTLTDKGREIGLRCKAQVTARWNSWLEDWDPTDVHHLLQSLGRLRMRIEADLMESAA